MSRNQKSKPDLFFRKQIDFTRVKRDGHRIQTPLFNLVYVERPNANPRVGIVVGRRLGKAVVRNRAKRVFRELARATRMELASGKEFLVFPKVRALQSNDRSVRGTWRAALTEAGLLDPHVGKSCCESP